MRAALVLMMVMATPVLAQAPQPAASPTLLSLTAEAEVTLPPDTLRLSAGVVTDAATSTDAMAANAARMNLLAATLKAAGVADRDMQTSNISLTAQQRYEPNQPPILTGYQARNSITVTTRKLADAGRLIDAMVKAGSNDINGPMFSIADPEAALNRARAAAMAKARARAEVYATAAGMHVRRIASITEMGSEAPRPQMRAMAMADSAESTPVQPGELQLSAAVTVTFELASHTP